MRPPLLVTLCGILVLALAIPGLPIGVGEGQDLTHVLLTEDQGDDVVVTVRILSAANDAHVSVLVRNANGTVLLTETVPLDQGRGEVTFRVDRTQDHGDFEVHLSGVTPGGSPTGYSSGTLSVAPLRSPKGFILFGYDGWLVLVALIGVSMVTLGVALRARDRKRSRRMVKGGIAPGAVGGSWHGAGKPPLQSGRVPGLLPSGGNAPSSVEHPLTDPNETFRPRGMGQPSPMPPSSSPSAPPMVAPLLPQAPPGHYCSRCGSAQSADTRFCTQCGSRRV